MHWIVPVETGWTVTVNETVAVLLDWPWPSSAVQVTVVVSTGKRLPEGGSSAGTLFTPLGALPFPPRTSLRIQTDVS